MNKKNLLELIAKKEARKAEIGVNIEKAASVEELRSLQKEVNQINEDITNYRSIADAMPDDVPPVDPGATDPALDNPTNDEHRDGTPAGGEKRGMVPKGQLNPLGTYRMGTNGTESDESRAVAMEESEKRGKALLAGGSVNYDSRSIILPFNRRSVTVGSSNIVVPNYYDNTLSPTFNEVSSLVDRVTSKMLIGGESYTKGYVIGYGTADYSGEAVEYNTTEPTFGYAGINKTKATAYAEDTEELLKLSAANYDAEVIAGVRIAIRKKLAREILVGTGASGHFVGIFSSLATAIDSDTDLSLSSIDEDTLDEIVFGFGGDEDVESTSVLIMSKADLKAFSKLRDANGKKIHTIVTNGNTGTIDTIPYIINSACYSIGTATTGQYCMAYGPLSNYLMTIFSDMDVQRSTDYKFKQGMIANRASIFAGGNVIAYNGFLRIKKA